jgi:uncharacterized protein (DUF2336 family)
MPELLYFLARDPAPAVRKAVARNRNTPRQADLLLALDEVPEIRTLVAQKITSQIQTLSQKDSAQIWQLTISVLEALARDDIPRVRRLIAETAHGIAKVPVTIMTSLSRDREPEVAVPALGYVGQIPDEDLVEIVARAPDQRVIGAVANRPAIGATVTAAVVEHGDQPAIAVLLRNKTANIAPQTLEKVVDRAPPVEAWHEPLVTRPNLTEAAAIRLASFVADKLVQFLQGRPELDAETNATIVTLAQQRREMPAVVATPPAAPENVDAPLARARRLYASGTLGEDLVMEAFGTDQDFVIAALSLRSRLPPAVVNKILVSHSAKGLTALSWKAGYTMRLAFQMQVRLAHLPPKARMSATTGGGYPLTPEEMEWQLEFFRTLVPAGM